MDDKIHQAGDAVLQCGLTIRDCRLGYKTYGTLNAAKDNVIVYPTWYSGQHYENEWLIGDDMALDPAKQFIIIPNMLGNGLSSSNLPGHLSVRAEVAVAECRISSATAIC